MSHIHTHPGTVFNDAFYAAVYRDLPVIPRGELAFEVERSVRVQDCEAVFFPETWFQKGLGYDLGEEVHGHWSAYTTIVACAAADAAAIYRGAGAKLLRLVTLAEAAPLISALSTSALTETPETKAAGEYCRAVGVRGVHQTKLDAKWEAVYVTHQLNAPAYVHFDGSMLIAASDETEAEHREAFLAGDRTNLGDS